MDVYGGGSVRRIRADPGSGPGQGSARGVPAQGPNIRVFFEERACASLVVVVVVASRLSQNGCPESPGNGRPERNRTSDSPLRRRVLFLLSYGSISRAKAPLRRFSRPPRARRHERCVPLCLAERAIRLGARLFHVAPAHAGRAADKLLPFERREGRRTLDTQLLMREPRRATGAGDTSLNALPAMNGRAGYTSPIAPVQ